MRQAWLVGLLSAILLLLFSGSHRLMDNDELQYAQGAKNSLDKGQWLPVMDMDKPLVDKPPLLPWLSALAQALFGNSERAVRLPTTLFSAACLGLLYFLAIRLTASPAWSLLAVALLVLQPDFIFHSRFLSMDSALAFCFMAAWWQLSGDNGQGRPRHAWLALLAALKSWFVFAFFPSLLLMLLAKPAWRFYIWRWALPLLLPSFLVLAGWVISYSAILGIDFLVAEWKVDLLGRVFQEVSGSALGHSPAVFYGHWAWSAAPFILLSLPIVLAGSRPWKGDAQDQQANMLRAMA